jgi:hypothetical protein
VRGKSQLTESLAADMPAPDRINWEWANKVLYRMCQDEPLHKSRDVVAGKLWLIGRSYSAQIERGAGHKGGSETLYTEVASKIVASDLDEQIDSVAHINRIDESNLPLVLAVHRALVDLLRGPTTRDRRSFASKYLHFHQPRAFFIYDSRAAAKIAEKVREKFGRVQFPLPPSCIKADPEYATFALRCLAYRDSRSPDLLPRELDAELSGYRYGL